MLFVKDAPKENLIVRGARVLDPVEGLDNQEIGYLLELAPKTVSKRHGRALLRLHAELAADGLAKDEL